MEHCRIQFPDRAHPFGHVEKRSQGFFPEPILPCLKDFEHLFLSCRVQIQVSDISQLLFQLQQFSLSTICIGPDRLLISRKSLISLELMLSGSRQKGERVMGAKVLQFRSKDGDSNPELDQMRRRELDQYFVPRIEKAEKVLAQLRAEYKSRMKKVNNDVGELEIYLKGKGVGTQKSYRGEIVRTDRWFRKRGQEITDDSLAAYLLHRFEKKGQAITTIRNCVAALKFRAECFDLDNPVGKKTKAALEYMKRNSRDRGRGQVNAILGQDIEKMEAVCEDDNNLMGLRDVALIRLMYDAALRISELAGLRFDEVAIGPDGRPRVFIYKSKTDQEGKGTHVRITPRTFDLVEEWKLRSGISKGPLFRAIRAEGISSTALTPGSVRYTIKKRAKQAGITKSVSGHSFRRGVAQQMILNGVSSTAVEKHCRWKSSYMLNLYCEGTNVRDSAIEGLYLED